MSRIKTHGSAIFITLLIFVFLACAFFFMEYSHHQSLVIQEKTSKTEKLLYYLEDYIEDKKDHLMLIANLWKRQPPGHREEQFLAIAQETIDFFPSYRFIAFLDRDLVIRHAAPQEQAIRVGLIGKDTSQDSENIIMLEKIMRTQKPLMSPAIWRGVLEVYGAHLWVPIMEGANLLGIISGDLDLTYIISELILKTDLSEHSIKINVRDIDIFSTDERQTYPVAVTHEIMDIPWTIGVYMDYRISPSNVFLSGVLLSFLVSFSVYKMLLKNRLLEQTRDELQNREENLSVTLQSIGDGMIATDAKGYITRMNPVAEELTGWLLTEALGKRIEEVFLIFNAKTGEPAISPVQQVLEKDKVVGLANDTVLIRRDGTRQQIADSAAPIKDNQANIKGVILVFSDITEQYRAQQLIKESEEKYRSLFNEMLDASALHKIVLDEKGEPCDFEFIEVNPAFKKITGTSDVVGRRATEVLPGFKTYSLELIRQLGKVALEGDSLTFEQFYEGLGNWYFIRAYSPKKGYFVCIFEDITDRKKKEDEIRKQKDRLTSILEGTNSGTWEWNVQTGETIFNQRWAEIIGYTLEELSPVSIETWMKYTHPDDLKTSNSMLEKHFTDKTDYYDVECRMKHKEGHWVWVHDRGKVISWTEDGKPLWMFGTHQEITVRKQAEDALVESEKRLNMLLSNTPAVIYSYVLKDGEPELTYVSQNVFNILGFEPEELIDDMALWQSCVHPDDLQKLYVNNQKIKEHKSPTSLEYRFKDKQGNYHWLHDEQKPYRKLADEIEVAGAWWDITARKKIEEQLRENEERLKLLSDNLPDGMVYQIDFGKEGSSRKFTYVSAGVERLHGVTSSEATQDPLVIYEQIIEEDLSLLATKEAECMANMSNFQMEFRVRRPSGEIRWHMVSSSPRRLANNHLIWDGLELDITERKQMEETIQYQHEFQKIVANISYSFINTPSSLMDEAINNALYQIGTFFQVDRSYLFQFSPDDMFVSYTHEWCRESIEPQISIICDQPVAELPWIIKEIRTKEFVFIPDVSTLAFKEEREELQRQNIQSLICIPIKVEERAAGFIGMDAVTEKMVWTDEDITLLKVICEIMSSAFLKHQMEQELIQRNQEVEHLNQHLNQEIEKAHQIHNDILPKELPSIQGISFAAFYQPAETLGGDFYDVIQSDKKLVIYLSDISGHGLDGGMINFFVKEAIDSYITLKPDDLNPGSILRHLERQFRREDYPDELFICIFLAVLDLETMELTYSGAGFQDTPLIRQGNGEQAKLSAIGLFIHSTFSIHKNNFPEKTITLTSGSTIFFNTDGLTEQGDPGNFYRDKLPQVFYENAHLAPDGISQAVLEDFRRFNNGSLQGKDDITFLILQVEPEDRRYQFELATDFVKLEDLRNQAVAILPNIKATEVLISCLYELTANAMEHGNQMDPIKKVMVELVVFDDYMQVSVEDEGEGFNWRDKVDKLLELEGYTERGRGIPMTRILCDNFYYNEEGNKVTCIVRYGKGG